MDEARAREVLAIVRRWVAPAYCSVDHLTAELGQYVAEREAAAVAAERERCARIVEENQESWSNIGGDHQSVAPRRHGNLTGLSYAAAIRSPQ